MDAITDRIYSISVRTLRGLYGLGIDTPPILDTKTYFPEARLLEQNWRAIRREALSLLDGLEQIPKFHELLIGQSDISDNDSIAWRFFVLKAYGRDQHVNQARCPVTSRLIRAIRSVRSAGFSILDAKKHIPAHRGPYRGILHYQLGLVVPEDDRGAPLAVLRIGDRRYRWVEGNGILWDDTYEHEAWNRGRSPRIILTLDVERRFMPPVLRALDRTICGIIARSRGLRAFLARSEATPQPGHSALLGTAASEPD